MKRRQLQHLGVPDGPAMEAAFRCCAAAARAGRVGSEIKSEVERVLADPAAHANDPTYAGLASALLGLAQRATRDAPRSEPLPYGTWGAEQIDAEAHAQMRGALSLPVAVGGALMPDAHVGYGLPIGGVLATEGAVVPYAVGVDIACRMMLTVFDLPADRALRDRERLSNILERNTLFGTGRSFKRRAEHRVMDEDWGVTPVTRGLKDKAWGQLGTSGSGNHFVEFGEFETLPGTATGIGLKPGTFLAVLSHSGSRGPGAAVAAHYSALARSLHPDLPRDLSYLAWLDMDREGAEYWAAMELMGRFASANHHVIHRKIADDVAAMGGGVVLQVENHHNYAWRERHTIGGVARDVIVHRKGATPAGPGVLGLIPGSMAAPGYLVRGLGEPRSLHSASHGAGRRLSRTKARESTRWSQLKGHLEAAGVHLLSAGLDESPHAYKDIEAVLDAQADLVERLARFTPRIVKMAPEGERPED
ncbi:MAG: RtcB family protein [Phycisphaerae bacterium]|nr:RtcB family protein [Phycisphaerae bacterium]